MTVSGGNYTLVAVIAAYKDLPSPIKELIDWDQQRLDVQVKYDQVVQHFAPERLMPAPEPGEEPTLHRREARLLRRESPRPSSTTAA